MRGKNFPPWLPGSEESQFLSIFACVHQHSGSRCLSWLGKVCRRISGSLNGTTALGWGVQNSRTEIKCQIIQKILSLIWPQTCFWHVLLLSKVTVSFRALLGEPSRSIGCTYLQHNTESRIHRKWQITKYTNSLVNADSFYTNFTNTTF